LEEGSASRQASKDYGGFFTGPSEGLTRRDRPGLTMEDFLKDLKKTSEDRGIRQGDAARDPWDPETDTLREREAVDLAKLGQAGGKPPKEDQEDPESWGNNIGHDLSQFEDGATFQADAPGFRDPGDPYALAISLGQYELHKSPPPKKLPPGAVVSVFQPYDDLSLFNSLAYCLGMFDIWEDATSLQKKISSFLAVNPGFDVKGRSVTDWVRQDCTKTNLVGVRQYAEALLEGYPPLYGGLMEMAVVNHLYSVSVGVYRLLTPVWEARVGGLDLSMVFNAKEPKNRGTILIIRDEDGHYDALVQAKWVDKDDADNYLRVSTWFPVREWTPEDDLPPESRPDWTPEDDLPPGFFRPDWRPDDQPW